MIKYVTLKAGKLSRETEDAAGFDIFSNENVTLLPGEMKIIKTGLVTEMSDNLYAEIWDKSGLAAKFHVTTRAGVIDSKYPGEWGVVMINEGKEPFIIRKGNKIAQCIFKEKVEFKQFTDLGEWINKVDVRTGGFGSTGK